MQNSKIKIIVLSVIAIAAVIFLFNFIQNKNKQAPKQGQVREASIVSGKVTKVEEDKIYLRTTKLEGQTGASPKVIFVDKVVLVAPSTVLVEEDPLNEDSSPLKLVDIKPGTQVVVYYVDVNAQNEYQALKISLALSADKYSVENLIKGLRK